MDSSDALFGAGGTNVGSGTNRRRGRAVDRHYTLIGCCPLELICAAGREPLVVGRGASSLFPGVRDSAHSAHIIAMSQLQILRSGARPVTKAPAA